MDRATRARQHIHIKYESEPIGGGNPYWRCKSCGQSDPYVSIEGHREGCEYVKLHGIRPRLLELLGRVEALVGVDSLLRFRIDVLETLETGVRVRTALEQALELMESATTAEDREAAQELAEELLGEMFE